MTLKALTLAAVLLMWSFQAHADPILTPLVATAFAQAGIASTFTIAGFSGVAVTTSLLTGGVPLKPSMLKAPSQ